MIVCCILVSAGTVNVSVVVNIATLPYQHENIIECVYV